MSEPTSYKRPRFWFDLITTAVAWWWPSWALALLIVL